MASKHLRSDLWKHLYLTALMGIFLIKVGLLALFFFKLNCFGLICHRSVERDDNQRVQIQQDVLELLTHSKFEWILCFEFVRT